MSGIKAQRSRRGHSDRIDQTALARSGLWSRLPVSPPTPWRALRPCESHLPCLRTSSADSSYPNASGTQKSQALATARGTRSGSTFGRRTATNGASSEKLTSRAEFRLQLRLLYRLNRCGTEPIVAQGSELSGAEIDQVRGLLRSHSNWPRPRLSLELCSLWDWHNAEGRPEDMSCRNLLLNKACHRRGQTANTATARPLPPPCTAAPS